jgi:hypothetical protein
VIGADTTVCQECQRTRAEKKIKKFYRTWEIIPDETTCLLEQGLLCCGIAIRAGCGAKCPQVNSPCIGCYGPNEGVHDYGARLMTALASIIDSDDPAEIDRIIREGIPDPAGSFSIALVWPAANCGEAGSTVRATAPRSRRVRWPRSTRPAVRSPWRAARHATPRTWERTDHVHGDEEPAHFHRSDHAS